ncbi:alpha/beta fold hydrolase [Siccirubricoccus sp. G192]|uniref:alpha/beta fold hydrolase n=1 Tax=Siccirubricoccus sp. G192 TaxID=2849651 RepID=UPI001C2C28E3|nr:alpha/beta fold hydrolase [Siccirubricoccus sp. G192]MBV1797904.1 alpha/beta fold hydrolase [Siccirubricoccus sp. G192]
MRRDSKRDRGVMQQAMAGTLEAPEALLARLDAAARRMETPCGDGLMVWRSWGEGEPLVLFHGGSGSWRHWIRNIEPLARHRRVVCPDLPGLGESAMPPPAETPAPIATLVRQGLTEMLGEGTRYDLAGFSFGALISGHLAAQAGPGLRSVTLIGAGALGLPRPRTELLKVRDKQGEARIAAHRHNLATLMLADSGQIDALALLVQEWNTEHGRFRSRGFAHGASLREAIAKARAPVALIYGERDAIAWPELERRFEALRAVQPEAWTGVIPGAGHWVAYEAAGAFNAMLLDMLRRRVGAA